MQFEKWDIMREPDGGESGLILLRDKTNPKKGTVVQLNYGAGQLQSAMPGDFPPGGGTWFAGISDYGVSYVAGTYSYSYARRKYNEMQADIDGERD